MEVVEFLKKPDRFNNLGGKMPKGVLLCAAAPTRARSHSADFALHLFLFLFVCFSRVPASSASLPHHIISFSFPPSLTTDAAGSYGPPGTGKTLLARAVAGEAACVMCHVSRVTCDV